MGPNVKINVWMRVKYCVQMERAYVHTHSKLLQVLVQPCGETMNHVCKYICKIGASANFTILYVLTAILLHSSPNRLIECLKAYNVCY